MNLLTRPLPHIVLVLRLTTFYHFGCSAADTNGTFNHPNFIIHFTDRPLPSKGLIIDDVEDLLPMIVKISSEFSQIFCVNKHIPIAVATRNKFLSMQNPSESVYKKLLEVYLQYSPMPLKGIDTTFVDPLVELADKSNDIFPGTVKYLLAHYYYFALFDYKKRWSLSETRKRFMNKNNSTHHTYKLGITFPLDGCEVEIWKSISILSAHVQLVAFHTFIVYKDQNNQTLEEIFINLTTQFKVCTNAVKTINSTLEQVFQTGISDTDPNGKQDYFALVKFWEMVNMWAITTNVKVIMFEAFDTPDSGNLRSTRGFWKLAQTPRRYSVPVDFIFMDKRLGNSLNISEEVFKAENNVELTKDLDFNHDNFVVVLDSNTISEYGGAHYYHHDDFLPIIRTIANEFSSVCLLNYDPAIIEAVTIHNSMTMQNKNQGNIQSLTQPLRLYPMFAFRDGNNLEYLLNATKTTNSLLPDTVQYLIFDFPQADKLFSYVTNVKTSIINQTVGLAITLPLLDCLRGTSVRTQVISLLYYVKLIIITVVIEQEDYDLGVEKTVVGFSKAFTRCKRKIESMSQRQSLKFAFSSHWPDTDSHSIQNYSNLVSFWGYMNNWAKMTNTIMFMTGAFDKISSNKTDGWWRFAFKTQIYHTIAEYVYVDKTERQNKISNGTLYVTNKTFPNVDATFQQKWKVANSSFSQTNFIVLFSPIIRKDHTKDGFNENQIRNIILKLFTRFSSICTGNLRNEDLLHNSMRYIPMEVAKYNLEREQTNASHNLYLTFVVDKKDDTFNATLRMANMANSVFAGSVQYLIAFIKQEAQLDYLTRAKQLLKMVSSRVSYKLASVYSIVDCGHGMNVRKETIPIIKVLDLIIFDLYAEDRDYEVGVYKSIQGFTKQFERCKQKIFQINSSIEVAFRTSWSDTTKYHSNGLENLVLFWEKMNEWAVFTNTKIFMMEAFDRHTEEMLSDSKLGWWRLLSEENHNGLPNYIFEEKREVVLKNLAKKKAFEGTSQPRTVLISVLSALAVSTITAFSVFLLVYRRYKNKLMEAKQYILTKKEEAEFLEGGFQSTCIKLDRELIVEAHLPKYDKTYEVEQEHFRFDETSPLGSGEFGIVCKGTVTNGEREINVAVKTLKKLNSSKAVKDLLVEIKVMIYLGKHKNIVSVIGAHTEEMRRGNVFLFMELCEKGSLQNYLRELRRQKLTLVTEQDEMNMNTRSHERGNDELDQIDFYQSIKHVVPNSSSYEKAVSREKPLHNIALDQNLLTRWSYEITNGMEFIASKKVVHADLATRNVLLTDKLTAKISDFGLSRRLYNYTNYVKTQTQPLPWKWMSPESLRRSEFNEKTDVWAFGITLWEIYSLGDAPYPGLSWSVNFPLRLEKGLRPQEPEFNANSVYSVMLRCWNIDPKNRPTFLQLKEVLNRMT